MSDPRLTPFNGHVAHVSLKGQVEAKRFVDGELLQVETDIAGLYRTPDGPLDRELLFGQGFLALETRDARVYGMAQRDGYCGWIDARRLGPVETLTHRVAVRESFMQEKPDLKALQRRYPLFFGSGLTVNDTKDDWSQISSRTGKPFYVPSQHLAPIASIEPDPVSVARKFLGVPYVWGGNSGRGVDCSGLVQAAYLASGWACPGDSDLQEALPGAQLTDAKMLERGDLVFWKGHVAMATGPERIIHANAHHMATVEEPLKNALTRIAATETGPVTSMLRVSPPRG